MQEVSQSGLPACQIGLRAGTLGGGIELAHAFTDTLGFRIGANGLHYDTTTTYESIDYDAILKRETGQLLFDWFAFSNSSTRWYRLDLPTCSEGNPCVG